MLENGGADGKLGHLQGHKDDAFNVTNEYFPGHIECAARAAFDYTSPVVLPGVAFTEMTLVGVGAHEGREELQGQSPAGDEAVGVNACEKTREILVAYARSRERVKIGVLEELDEVEDISFCQVVGKRLGQ